MSGQLSGGRFGRGFQFKWQFGKSKDDVLELFLDVNDDRDGRAQMAAFARCVQGKKRAAKSKEMRTRKLESITAKDLVDLFTLVLDGVVQDAKSEGISIPAA